MHWKKMLPHNKYNDTIFKKRFWKFLYQKLTRGWTDAETWSLDYTFAKYMLPRLERYEELTKGYTGNDEHHDKIEWIMTALNDIVLEEDNRNIWQIINQEQAVELINNLTQLTSKAKRIEYLEKYHMPKTWINCYTELNGKMISEWHRNYGLQCLAEEFRNLWW